MLEKIASWLFGTSSPWVYGLVAVAAFASGWWIASTVHERDFEEKRADYFAQLQAQEKAFREKENALATQVSAALAARDDAVADAAAARADSVRLRDEADALADRLSRASGGSCDRERESLASCVRLLGEGVDLAGEGAALFGRSAADIEVMRRALEAE